jgi:hypothetical protein
MAKTESRSASPALGLMSVDCPDQAGASRTLGHHLLHSPMSLQMGASMPLTVEGNFRNASVANCHHDG